MAGDDTEIQGFMESKMPNSMRSRKRSFSALKAWRRSWCRIRKLGPNLGLEILVDQSRVGNSTMIAANNNKNINNNNNENHKNNVSSVNSNNGYRVRIPADAVFCRTESRTKRYAFGIFPAKERKPLIYLAAGSENECQKWMANIRQMLKPRRHRFMDGTFNVSMVDNAHSRSAGLTGLYGDMVVSCSGVYVKDVHTSEVVELFNWKETDSVHLACQGREDDVKRICVVHTTKEFRCGVGELWIYCPDASQLLVDLVRQGKGPRKNRTNRAQRPLSLSEGDLRLMSLHQLHHQQYLPYQNCDDDNDEKIIQQQENQERKKNASSTLRRQHTFRAIKHKITSNVINAGLGLLSPYRAGSEIKLINDIEKDQIIDKLKSNNKFKKRAVDNLYYSEPKTTTISSSLEELEEPPLRRFSRLSIASGIYEEIHDSFVSTARHVQATVMPVELYEDLTDYVLGSKLLPPPLPPRKRSSSGSTRCGSISDDGFDSEGDTRSATSSIQGDATPTQEDLKLHDYQQKFATPIVDESEYVQMSPRPQDFVDRELQQQIQLENMYMVMR